MDMESGDRSGTMNLIYNTQNRKEIRLNIIGKEKEKETSNGSISVQESPERGISKTSIWTISNLLIFLIILFVIFDLYILTRKKREKQ
jgi:hypothetical protein